MVDASCIQKSSQGETRGGENLEDKYMTLGKGKGKQDIAVRKLTSPLREITYHMGSHSVTCHPAEVNFSPLPKPKLVLDLSTPKGCKAELT